MTLTVEFSVVEIKINHIKSCKYNLIQKSATIKSSKLSEDYSGDADCEWSNGVKINDKIMVMFESAVIWYQIKQKIIDYFLLLFQIFTTNNNNNNHPSRSEDLYIIFLLLFNIVSEPTNKQISYCHPIVIMQVDV